VTDPPIVDVDDAEASEEQPGRRPRWWPIGVGAAIGLFVIWAFATAWVGIWGSSPAYLITLLLSLAVAIGTRRLGAPRRSARPAVRVADLVGPRRLLVLGGVLIGALVYLEPLSAEPIAIDALVDGNGVTVDVSRSSIR
jgi:hypothetical protein